MHSNTKKNTKNKPARASPAAANPEARAQMKQQQPPAAVLPLVNGSLLARVLLYLTHDEREFLGTIDPRCRSPPTKKPTNKKNGSSKDGSAATTTTAIANLNLKLNLNEDSSNKEENVTTTDENNQKEEDKKQSENDNKNKNNVYYVVTDPDTLLARLNTRRLYKRMKYIKSQRRKQVGSVPLSNNDGTMTAAISTEEEKEEDGSNNDDDVTASTDQQHEQSYEDGRGSASASLVVPFYPRNRTTQEIAEIEWLQVLERAKQQNLSRNKNKNQNSGNNNNNNNDNSTPSDFHDHDLPSPYELLLFSPCPRPVTVLASYPRSGNSLLRNLFEKTCLRVTGSDMRGGLTQHDLVGEAAVSCQKVQFVKTHYPERYGQPKFRASRAVLLVRNPYDALDSYYNLMMTNTHTKSLPEDIRKQHDELFSEMVLKEIHVWRIFHQFWLQKTKIPILLIRYEDLIRHPDKVLARVLQFVLEINNMTFFQNRINRCVREEQIENLGRYKPRSGGIGKSLKRYNHNVLRQIHNHPGIVDLLHQLGYGECVTKPNQPEQWTLSPIPNFGFELPKRTRGQVVMINGGPIARGPKLRTDWKEWRQKVRTDFPSFFSGQTTTDIEKPNPYDEDNHVPDSSSSGGDGDV